jgi:hypothetical protein
MVKKLTPEQVRWGSWKRAYNGRLLHFVTNGDETACGKTLVFHHAWDSIRGRDQRCPACDRLVETSKAGG